MADIPIHFHAQFLPNYRVFKVSVKLGKKKAIVERMTISKFIRFARAKDKPLTIGGTTIEVAGASHDEAQQVLAPVRAYFEKVAESYISIAWGKAENN
jgi:uncharacterized protein YajQ (UPF0234 family)